MRGDRSHSARTERFRRSPDFDFGSTKRDAIATPRPTRRTRPGRGRSLAPVDGRGRVRVGLLDVGGVDSGSRFEGFGRGSGGVAFDFKPVDLGFDGGARGRLLLRDVVLGELLLRAVGGRRGGGSGGFEGRGCGAGRFEGRGVSRGRGFGVEVLPLLGFGAGSGGIAGGARGGVLGVEGVGRGRVFRGGIAVRDRSRDTRGGGSRFARSVDRDASAGGRRGLSGDRLTDSNDGSSAWTRGPDFD